MKTNKMIRLASILLILVMLTTCAISGTFAKYVTSGSSQDSARVAKWGIDITVTAEDAFAKEYDKGSSNPTVKAEASSTVDILAPGTSGVLCYAKITGTPEVAYSLSIAARLNLQNWKIDTNNDGVLDTEYCPLLFIVGVEQFFIGKSGINTVAQLESAVQKAVMELLINQTSAPIKKTATGMESIITLYEFASNAISDAETGITWSWSYENGAAGNGNDVYDTKLGDLAAEGKAPTISFSLSVSATQVD